MLLSQFPLTFPANSQQDSPFHRIACDYSRADWDGLRDHFRDVPWEDIFKTGASARASKICEWVQVKPHSSPWFSTACAAAIVHLNYFFRLYQKEKSDSKVKFRQASPTNLALVTSGKLLIVLSTKVNLLYFLYSKAQRHCLLHLMKQNFC